MNAYIVAGYRTAVGKAPRGVFRFTRPDDLAAEVIKHLVAQVPALDPTRVDDLIVGNAVPEAEQGMQIARYIALFKAGIQGMKMGRYISEHDAKIAEKLAYVISGGDLSYPQLVSEQYLLDLEREAFLSLSAEKKTLERMQSLLNGGKPLRN